MRVQPLRVWKPPKWCGFQSEGMVQEATWSARVDDKAGAEANRTPAATAREHNAIARFVEAYEQGLVEVVDSGGLRFADQRVIEIGTIPVRVADLIERAG